MLVIAKRIGDSEDKRVSFVCLFLDGCHSSFHIHHGVESETKIVKLPYLLSECGYISWVTMRPLCGVGAVWVHGEDVEWR